MPRTGHDQNAQQSQSHADYEPRSGDDVPDQGATVKGLAEFHGALLGVGRNVEFWV
jgi:hypothetical protein